MVNLWWLVYCVWSLWWGGWDETPPPPMVVCRWLGSPATSPGSITAVYVREIIPWLDSLNPPPIPWSMCWRGKECNVSWVTMESRAYCCLIYTLLGWFHDHALFQGDLAVIRAAMCLCCQPLFFICRSVRDVYPHWWAVCSLCSVWTPQS